MLADFNGCCGTLKVAVFAIGAGGSYALRHSTDVGGCCAVWGESCPKGDTLSELQLILSYNDALELPEIVEHEVETVEIEALGLGCAEQSLARIFVGRELQLDSVVVLKLIASVKA